jgi:hypothetical protein
MCVRDLVLSDGKCRLSLIYYKYNRINSIKIKKNPCVHLCRINSGFEKLPEINATLHTAGIFVTRNRRKMLRIKFFDTFVFCEPREVFTDVWFRDPFFWDMTPWPRNKKSSKLCLEQILIQAYTVMYFATVLDQLLRKEKRIFQCGCHTPFILHRTH